MNEDKVRVLIVDDHPHAREGIRDILSGDSLFEVIGEAQNGLEAIELTELVQPDMILMDIDMKQMGGLDATKAIKSQFPDIKIVVVTVSDHISDLFEALKRGAQGYLIKNLNASTWLEYLRAIAFDEVPLSQEIAQRILNEFSRNKIQVNDDSPLTNREKEILKHVAEGMLNRDIATELVISEHTVKNHMKNILQKLHLQNRVQLARYAYENGIYEL